jgi:hypothetical protein
VTGLDILEGRKTPMAAVPKRGVWCLCFLLSVLFCCCSRQDTGDAKTLVRINDYNLFLDEFQHELAQELELDSDFKLTEEAKKEFLEGLIKKQILIQEAKRLKLDTKEDFVRVIQRYWESTLIRNLLDLKGQEISKAIYVSEDEIQKRYEEKVKSGESLAPLTTVREEVRQQLLEEKKTGMLEGWVGELRKKATIQISEDLL